MTIPSPFPLLIAAMTMLPLGLEAATDTPASDAQPAALTLESITSGTFAAKSVSGIRPIAGTDLYSQVSADGRQVITRSFRTGKQQGVLFDISATEGEHIDDFDSYELTMGGKRLLIATHRKAVYRRSYTADHYIYNVDTRRLTRLSQQGGEQVPTFSPDGQHVAFVRGGNIFIATGGKERQVTFDGEFNKIINGVPDWVNEEEFAFSKALAWSADSRQLMWIRYDESRVKTYALQLFAGQKPRRDDYATYPGAYAFKYPKAGEDNSTPTLWAYSLDTEAAVEMPLPLEADGYIPRLLPTSEPSTLLALTMNRHQDSLRVYRVDPKAIAVDLILTESVPRYVKEEALEGIRLTGTTLLLPSDRTGTMQLYAYNLDGKLTAQLTSGSHEVTQVYGVDPRTGDVYYQVAAPTAHDRQVMRATMKGRQELLTPGDGTHTAIFSGDYRHMVHIHSSYSQAPRYTQRPVKAKAGARETVLEDNEKLMQLAREAGFCQRDTFSFVTSEGVALDGWMVRPQHMEAGKKYPVILFQYSGPGSQQVVNAWNAGSMGQGGAFDSYLAHKGYVVVCVDGRGTGGRGADFEKQTYLRLGDLEARDQVETARWVARQPWADASRIGIWGWSYGGFCTLMSMSDGSGIFRAGVAVAPPTDWRFYDTIYTERYLRTPQENPEGYDTNPTVRVEGLKGALLICHGLADDNVHPQNTFEYTEALVQHDKDFKENIYTNRNHSIFGGNTRRHLLRQITEWFDEKMK